MSERTSHIIVSIGTCCCAPYLQFRRTISGKPDARTILRASRSTRILLGYEREISSKRSSTIRVCAELGRNSSDGEPAKSPRENYRRLRLQCKLVSSKGMRRVADD